MNRTKLDDWCEKGILGLVLAILVFGPLALGGVNQRQFAIITALTMGVMLLWGARLWISPQPRLLWPPICWAVLAFAVYAIVRYCVADLEYVARQELTRILVYTFLFFAILNNLYRQERIQSITLVLVFLGMAISLYAGWQFATHSTRVWNLYGAYEGRGSGTFIYPNSLAAFLEMLVPLGLSMTLIGRLPHLAKIFLGYATVVMLAGIGVTLSRGGWIVTAVTLAALFGVLFFQPGWRIHATVMLVVLALAGAVALPKAQVVRQRFQTALMSGNADDVRFAIWRAGYLMWKDHLLWGVGPAHFDYRFREYRPAEVQKRPNRVHNDYLNTLVDWGVAGAVIVASGWALLYWGVFRVWKFVRGARDDLATRKKSNKFAFLIGASLGLVAILLHSAIDFNMHIPANAILAVTLMALLSSQWRFATEQYWFSAGNISKCSVALVLAAGCCYLATQGWRGAREDYWLRVAAQSPVLSEARVAALSKASQIEPANFETTYSIAEFYHKQSWKGGDDYVALARKAMEWYRRGMNLNPYYGYNWLHYGRCLDWIGTAGGGTQEDAMKYYRRAEELDPNGYTTAAYIGWHFVETGDYAAARSWLERSRRLEWVSNDLVSMYLPIAERRLQEEAQRRK